MKLKYTLNKLERTTVSIDKGLHILVKAYALRKKITVAEAVWQLLGRALAEEECIKSDKKEY